MKRDNSIKKVVILLAILLMIFGLSFIFHSYFGSFSSGSSTNIHTSYKEVTCMDGRVVQSKENCYSPFTIFVAPVVPFYEREGDVNYNNTYNIKNQINFDESPIGGYYYMFYSRGIAGTWVDLYIGTQYSGEPISCRIKKYYNNNFDSAFEEDMHTYGRIHVIGRNDKQSDSIILKFEETVKPSRVRYDVTCTGKESNYSSSASTTLYLTYPA